MSKTLATEIATRTLEVINPANRTVAPTTLVAGLDGG